MNPARKTISGISESLTRAGQVLLGKYRVERLLGHGGMGVVLAARHVELRELVAVKLLRTDLNGGPNASSRFLREARAAARLTSEHVARVHDVGRLEDETPYMLMEYLDGSDLAKIVKSNGPLPVLDAVDLVLQACDAIAEAHALGIIHRDLKLANLFLAQRRSGKTVLKVLDFGISKVETAEKLTNPDALMGTPDYMSPEQFLDPHAIDGRSDIWAMGVILYELTTGQLPFSGDTLVRTIGNVLRGEPMEPSALRSDISPELNEVIMCCLRKEPAQRYSTITALVTSLQSLLAPDGPPGTTSVALRSASDGDGDIATASRVPSVFICCRTDDAEDLRLALVFYEEVRTLGFSAFLAPKSVSNDPRWVNIVSHAIRGADAFVLLLSRRAAVSELVAAELDACRQVCEQNGGKPRILTVHVRFSEDDAANHPLRERLHDLPQVAWNSPVDTAAVVAALLVQVGEQRRSYNTPASIPRDISLAVPAEGQGDAQAAKSSHLELPGGVVSSKSLFYVSRTSIDDVCLREIVKPGALVRIKAPRQMGKTSLMTRLLEHANSAGARVVSVNLQMAEAAVRADLTRFLRWLCAVVARRLSLGRIDDTWDDIFGAKDNCTAYFEEHVLSDGPPLVLALDHVDRLFESSHTAEEVLSLLRAWHEMGKSQDPWPNLRLVLTYSTEMYVPMNINRSPFNVGLPAILSEWDQGILYALARQHGLNWGQAEVDELMAILGGHPHLIRIALYHIAGGTPLREVMATAATDQGLFADHLKHLLWQIQCSPELCEAAQRVMTASEPVRLSAELSFRLASLGLVRLQGNEVRPARELYRRYLTERLHAMTPSTRSGA